MMTWKTPAWVLVSGMLLIQFCGHSPQPVAAHDKKDTERIAALEKRVKDLEDGQAAMDAGLQEAFKKEAEILDHLLSRQDDLNERLKEIEKSRQRAE